MNKICALLLAATTPMLYCARIPRIPSGSAVYIEPMGGYETYLAAAFTKKHVPLVVVSDRGKAEFVITSTVPRNDLIGGQSAGVESNSNMAMATAESASIAVIDLRGSRIIFSYAAGKVGSNQPQKMAEDCAKHLRGIIDNVKE